LRAGLFCMRLLVLGIRKESIEVTISSEGFSENTKNHQMQMATP